ncbi:MAG TPA: DHH family phosphoesterase [Candidatus Limnocylindria bacterium]
MLTRAETLHGAAAVADALRSARRVTAICHENPDADTLGAAIAISLIAARMGAASEVVSVDPPSPAFDFLPGFDAIRRAPGLEPDIAVVCDAATIDRVGRIVVDQAAWLSRALLVNIDHHITNSGFGAVNLVDPRAAATCQVLAELLPFLDVPLDADIATALLTGIVRDSHGFSDASTSPATLRIAATLMEAGAALPDIHRRVLAELPYRTLTLWARMLSTVDQACNGRIVYATLTEVMLAETGAQQADADGLAEFLGRVEGADVVLLFREVGPSSTRVSIRTSAAVDAHEIAGQLGGGGHARRAGCGVDRPLSEMIGVVIGISASALPSD